MNQGAQLQMYCLHHQLKEMHHNPYILTYEKNFDFEKEEQLKNDITWKSIPYIIKNYVMKKGLRLTLHNILKYLVCKKFDRYHYRYLEYNTDQIQVVIVGSDEVFSIPVGLNKMMFGYGVKATYQIAYAPSFGQTDINRLREYQCEAIVRDGLKGFTALSARDNHSAQIIQNYTNIMPDIVCDPVILYDLSNTAIKFKKPKYRYLIVYAYDRHMNDLYQIKAIKRFARKRNLKIISPGTYHSWCDKNIVCNPLEWVQWFKYADYVITDTFHGTIVSTITNTKMAIYIRPTINQHKMTDVIQRLGIENRTLQAITECQLEQVYERPIDFSQINNNVQKLRDEGTQYLAEALQQCKETKKS
jgi:polysaccharide pyruvyl transferase WcaK-like protein